MKIYIDRGKVFFILLPIFLVLILSVALYLSTRQENEPQNTVTNIHPCLHEADKWVLVDEFTIDDIKYICADFKTDSPPIRLTLTVESVKNLFNAFAYDTTSRGGFITILIRDQLSPGTYHISIMYAREILDSTNFSVKDK